MTTQIEPQPTHCPSCLAPFQHHQAFGKPAGVVGYTACECVRTVSLDCLTTVTPLTTTGEVVRFAEDYSDRPEVVLVMRPNEDMGAMLQAERIASLGSRLRHLQVGHVDHERANLTRTLSALRSMDDAKMMPQEMSQHNRSDLMKRLRAIGMSDDEIGVAKAVDAPVVVVMPESRPLNTTREEARRRRQRERMDAKAIETAERLEKEQQSRSNAVAREVVRSQRKAAEREVRAEARMKEWEYLFDDVPLYLLSRSDPRNAVRLDRAIVAMNEHADRENGIDDK